MIRHPRYSKEDFARRGSGIYERDIRPFVEADNKNKFVALDIETGAWELDADALTACRRLICRFPDCQTWLMRVDHAYLHRIVRLSNTSRRTNTD